MINTSKSDIGKQKFDKVVAKILEFSNVNQWKNTSSVLGWYKNIAHKNQCIFVNFDIENFYPSISCNLFKKAVDYAQSFYTISDDELSIKPHIKEKYMKINKGTGISNELQTIIPRQVFLTIYKSFIRPQRFSSFLFFFLFSFFFFLLSK